MNLSSRPCRRWLSAWPISCQATCQEDYLADTLDAPLIVRPSPGGEGVEYVTKFKSQRGSTAGRSSRSIVSPLGVRSCSNT
jgi:hypothetical protein